MNKRFFARHIALDEYRRKQVDTWGGKAIPQSEHLMVLEDHLSVSLRRRSNAYPLFKLQFALLMDVHNAEKAVAACKQKIAEIEKDPEGAARDAHLESVGAEHKKFTTIRRALRDIGDGMAWRLLGCDRAALSLLATHARKPHINLDGLSAELQALADEYNHPGGRLAVLNDLTHYLKKADITVRVDDDTFELLEVKSSRTKSATLKRQRADLEETLQFLSEGRGVQGEDVAVIRQLPVVPSSYMKVIATLIREAERAGIAAGVIGEHLAVQLIDWPTVFELDVDDTSKLEKVDAVAEGWRQRGDLVLRVSGTDRYHEVRNYAPYSIYPFPELHRVKLMTGALFTESYLNVSAVLRYIESRGWKLVRGPESLVVGGAGAQTASKFGSTAVAAFQKGPLTMEIPGPWLGRIVYEYLAPRTIVEGFEAMLAAGPAPEAIAWVNFTDEAEQWD